MNYNIFLRIKKFNSKFYNFVVKILMWIGLFEGSQLSYICDPFIQRKIIFTSAFEIRVEKNNSEKIIFSTFKEFRNMMTKNKNN